MFGLPTNIDLDFFNGKTLIQICIGAHDLIFKFDDSVSISVTSMIGWENATQEKNNYDDYRYAASAIAMALNQSIISASTDGNGTLKLKFESGDCLDIYDSNKKYESYNIWNKDKLIVV